MAATRNNIGKSIYMSSSLPATNDSTGFEALTWTQINGVQQLPQLGVDHANIDVPDLLTGFTTGIKGATSGVVSQMTFRKVASDTGQANLRTASDDSQGLIAIKIGTGSGTAGALVTGDAVQYAQGYAFGYQENQGNETTHEGFTVSFHQNALTIDATEPV